MRRGFSLIEVILAGSVLSLILMAFVGAFLYGQESTALAGLRARAVSLAEEGLEAVRNIRDDDFTNLVDGTYGLATSSNTWILSGSNDVVDVFTRTITVSTVDTNRKDITSNVTWQQNATRTGSVTLSSRLTYWMQVSTSIGDWSNAATSSLNNISGNQNGWKVQTVGDYAYVVRNGGNPDFIVFDVSDPDNPSTADSLNLSGNPQNIAISGDYAYVVTTSNSGELQIVDISTPTSVSVVGTYNAPGNANMFGVYAIGTNAYLSRDSSSQDEFYIIDASTPASPTLMGSLELGADSNEVYVSGNYAYIASDDNSEELQVVDISTPATPTQAGSLDLSTNDNGETITGFGSTVIVGRITNDGFIHIIDVSTPTSPSELGSTSAGDDVRDIDLGNNNEYLFVATDDNNSEFQVFDISTLSTPSQLGTVDLGGDANGIAYSSDHDRAFGVTDDNSEEFVVIAPQ